MVQIHPNGYIIGGAHDKGLRLAAAARAAGRGYFEYQISVGNIVVEYKRNTLRYRVRRTPRVAFGSPDELALLRAQHFLRVNQKKWMQTAAFDQRFSAVFDNLVNVFKS